MADMSLRIEIIPEKAVVISRDKTVVAASWFGPNVMRPYIYPFLGPNDREVTRLGHPLDPVSHSHHRGIWLGHHDVAGVSFWEEAAGAGRIEQTRARVGTKEGEVVDVVLECTWRTARGEALLDEARSLRFLDLPLGQLALEIDTTLRASSADRPVLLGDTPFGVLGLRVARTMRVAEGLGGRILNSQEAENEAGCFWQHATWCDYSGPVPLSGLVSAPPPESPDGRVALPAAVVGIACFDHPENSREGTLWHVRDDGWLGPAATKGAPRTIRRDEPLRLRYRIEAHAGHAEDARLSARYRAWRSGG